MDILSHSFSGIATGTVVAAFAKGGLKTKGVIILTGGIAGALPDLDAISLYSKFDQTIGQFLELQHSGHQIYFGKYFYSHHAALHSTTLSAVIPIMILLFSLLIKKLRKKPFSFCKSFMGKSHLLAVFVLAFNIHLLEDMPTPHCVWGGVNLFWPSSEYYGGFGKIWWWNNYDIFLIILSVIATNIILLTINKFKSIPVKKLTSLVFVLGFSLSLYQINNRGFDFNYKGHNVDFQLYEKKSKEIQHEILGDYWYKKMLDFDNSINLNF